jgi:lipopolysaccharide export system permease protein
MAVLVAVLYGFSQLAADNEITALKASGTNLVTLLVPLLVAATILTGLMVWFNDRVLPETNHQLSLLLADANRKSPTFLLNEQVVNEIPTSDLRRRYFIQAGQIDRGVNVLEDVVIYDMSESTRARTIYAERGRMDFNSDQTDLLLTLDDGWVQEVTENAMETYDRVYFERQQTVLEGVGDELRRNEEGRSRSDREMSIAMLRAQVDTARQGLATYRDSAAVVARMALEDVLAGARDFRGAGSAAFRSGRVNLAEVPGAADALARGRAADDEDALAQRVAVDLEVLSAQAQHAQREINRNQVEIHKKWAIPFACIVFVLLGAPLAVRFPRGGVGMVIAISLTIFAIYYMSLIGGESLGDEGTIAPFWGPWGPNLIFFVIALLALARIGRETSTSRGGGWDDLMATLRGAALRPLRLLGRGGG